MADDKVVVTDPAEVLKKIEADTAAREEEIKALKAQVSDLEKQLKKAQKSKGLDLPEGDYASFGGQIYSIVGDFRADNTFVEVKRGYCDEGCTLLAIARPH